jgi:exopolysaccharide biosynthesis polyprenyl glycosylphosphotransferase
VNTAAPAAVYLDVLEHPLDDHWERADAEAPRYRVVATVLGRITILAAGVASVLVGVGVQEAILALGALVLTYVVVQRVREALPPAVRFTAVTATGITMTVGFGTILAIEFGRRDFNHGRLLLALVTIVALSILFEIWVERTRPAARILMIGDSSGGAELARGLVEDANLKWLLVGLVVCRTETAGAEVRMTFRDLVAERRPDLVVLTESKSNGETLAALLDVPNPTFRLMSFDHFCEYAFGRIPIWNVSPMWFMSLLHAYRRTYRRATKRAVDVVLASGTILLLWPLLLLITLAVRLSGSGPIFYRQIRAGEAGAPFEILKFRTMTNGAESSGAVWAEENDERVTSIGRSLRRFRLDELPQVWNVLKGEMSMIGPRPERPEFVEMLEREIPHWSRRHLVKPGITGWAQVSMGYTDDATTAADKLAYDLYYIKHRTLTLDLAICLKTVRVVLRGQGAR